LILVDSSVWIDVMRAGPDGATQRLLQLAAETPVVVADLVLLEVLMGERDDRAAASAERLFRRFPIVEVTSEEIALEAAAHYRRLRALGFTPRSTIDVLIATWCIANDATLLHRDRDFDPMVQHLGLRAIAA
jgi:hypothetical protein